jgi:hypothetical protein
MAGCPRQHAVGNEHGGLLLGAGGQHQVVRDSWLQLRLLQQLPRRGEGIATIYMIKQEEQALYSWIQGLQGSTQLQNPGIQQLLATARQRTVLNAPPLTSSLPACSTLSLSLAAGNSLVTVEHGLARV